MLFPGIAGYLSRSRKEKELKDAKQLFSEVFMGYEETRKRALSIEQLRMVADADLEEIHQVWGGTGSVYSFLLSTRDSFYRFSLLEEDGYSG